MLQITNTGEIPTVLAIYIGLQAQCTQKTYLTPRPQLETIVIKFGEIQTALTVYIGLQAHPKNSLDAQAPTGDH